MRAPVKSRVCVCVCPHEPPGNPEPRPPSSERETPAQSAPVLLPRRFEAARGASGRARAAVRLGRDEDAGRLGAPQRTGGEVVSRPRTPGGRGRRVFGISSNTLAWSRPSSPGPAGGASDGHGLGRGAAGPDHLCTSPVRLPRPGRSESSFRTDPSACPIMLRHRYR